MEVQRAFMLADTIAIDNSTQHSVRQAARQLASMLAHRFTASTEGRNVDRLLKPYKATIPRSTNDTRLLWTKLDGIVAQAAVLLQTKNDATRSIILPKPPADRLIKMIQAHDPRIEKAGIRSIEQAVQGVSPSLVSKLKDSSATAASLNAMITVGLALVLTLV